MTDLTALPKGLLVGMVQERNRQYFGGDAWTLPYIFNGNWTKTEIVELYVRLSAAVRAKQAGNEALARGLYSGAALTTDGYQEAIQSEKERLT